MNKKKLSILIICVLLSLSIPLSVAGEERPDNYATFKIGQYSPTGGLDDDGFDSKVALEIIFGHYFNKNFSLEGGFGVFGSDNDNAGQTVYFTGFATPLLTAKAILPKESFEFYGGAGIGYYQGKIAVYDPDDEESDSAFGYHVVAGFSYNFTPYWYLGMEGKQIWTDDFDFKGYKVDADGRIMTLNVGLRW